MRESSEGGVQRHSARKGEENGDLGKLDATHDAVLKRFGRIEIAIPPLASKDCNTPAEMCFLPSLLVGESRVYLPAHPSISGSNCIAWFQDSSRLNGRRKPLLFGVDCQRSLAVRSLSGMTQLEMVCDDDVRSLLIFASPNRATDVSALLNELKPVWLLDRESDGIVFRARPGVPNQIHMGLKCSKRLQVHAYAAAVILSSIGKSQEERGRILAPVDEMLNWAVGVELATCLDDIGSRLPDGHVLRKTDGDIPHHLLAKINEGNKIVGAGFYKFATAWILLHELGHLKLGHSYQRGLPSLVQEKEADRFAAEWMMESASRSETDQHEFDRLCALFGTSVALLWLTVFNVYLGRMESDSHPEGYDRLFQVLDQVTDRENSIECEAVWQSIAILLFIHMRSAGYDFDASYAIHTQGNSRDEVNYLIDRISKAQRST